MISKIEDALNEQLNYELFSAYQYMAMAAHFDEKGLEGFSSWMKAQAKEELEHVSKFYNFIFARGGMVKLGKIDAPKGSWTQPIDVFKAGLERERGVTERINNIVDMAHKEKDHATHNFLQWFIQEQVEEEDQFHNIIQKLKLVGDNPAGLVMLNEQLGARPSESAAE